MDVKVRLVTPNVVAPTGFVQPHFVVEPVDPKESTPAKPLIMLYVRRGDSADPKVKARTISMHPIPDKVSMDQLLTIGFGFDGDTVSLGVTPDTEASWEKDGTVTIAYLEGAQPWIRRGEVAPSWTLADALNSVQSVLVAWLRSLGYEVKIA